MAQKVNVAGVVQGVGFRPFVYGLAKRLQLHGWVRNTSGGVEIVVDGESQNIELFVKALVVEKPPLARIDSITTQAEAGDTEYTAFDIRPSADVLNGYQPISPDAAICRDCERELFDPKNRRYLYPFINCTNCGPRFTIIKDIPYDRPATTMADFEMCDDCRREYENPLDRRFHAQPIACPACGPSVHLRHTLDEAKNIVEIDSNLSAILKTRRILREGKIVAVKGLGGFHLACDASDPKAVNELRRRKGRSDKPFALMAADIKIAKSICDVNDREFELLMSREKPIVLLPKKILKVCSEVSPGLDSLGVMLPYTPLHHLLLNQTDPRLQFEPSPALLVMTSGNFSEEPIAADNVDAMQRLTSLADAFLLHNRDIYERCDDSVVKVDKNETLYLRRSRGYAPYPVQLPFQVRPTLAVGGELKNTFCLARDRYAFLSQHIGDMENAETCESFEQNVGRLSNIFRVKPELIAYDLHPNYFTTQYAKHVSGAHIGVQHHHAHIAACMADNGVDNRRVIGLAFDGTGYGTDGAIWGGEALLASCADFERFAHLEYLPLPGGDSAIRHPWKIAAGYARALGIDVDDLPFLQNIDKRGVNVVRQQVDKDINTVPTSSMGRLFDAVASLIGIRNDVTYEAQAAIEMEVLSRLFLRMAKPYPYSIDACRPGHSAGLLRPKLEALPPCQPLPQSGATFVIRLKELLEAIVKSARSGEQTAMIGARFHKTIAAIAVEICKRARIQTNLNEVALSGGVWQNQILMNLARDGLEREGFVVYFHKQIPTNDGGLCLGQAVVANCSGAQELAPAKTDSKLPDSKN